MISQTQMDNPISIIKFKGADKKKELFLVSFLILQMDVIKSNLV